MGQNIKIEKMPVKLVKQFIRHSSMTTSDPKSSLVISHKPRNSTFSGSWLSLKRLIKKMLHDLWRKSFLLNFLRTLSLKNENHSNSVLQDFSIKEAYFSPNFLCNEVHLVQQLAKKLDFLAFSSMKQTFSQGIENTLKVT